MDIRPNRHVRTGGGAAEKGGGEPRPPAHTAGAAAPVVVVRAGPRRYRSGKVRVKRLVECRRPDLAWRSVRLKSRRSRCGCARHQRGSRPGRRRRSSAPTGGAIASDGPISNCRSPFALTGCSPSPPGKYALPVKRVSSSAADRAVGAVARREAGKRRVANVFRWFGTRRPRAARRTPECRLQVRRLPRGCSRPRSRRRDRPGDAWRSPARCFPLRSTSDRPRDVERGADRSVRGLAGHRLPGARRG
mgnify:CR=1 FL=1